MDSVLPELSLDEVSVVDRLADVSIADVSLADASVADVSLADASVADVSLADASVADVSLADVSVADLSVADASVADVSLAEASVAEVSLADVSVVEVSPADVSMSDSARHQGSMFGELSLNEVSVSESLQGSGSSADEQVEAAGTSGVQDRALALGLPSQPLSLRIEDEPLPWPTPLVLASQVLPGAWPDRSPSTSDEALDGAIGSDPSGELGPSRAWSSDVEDDVGFASRSDPQLEDYLDDAPITEQLLGQQWVSPVLIDQFSQGSDSDRPLTNSLTDDDWLRASAADQRVTSGEEGLVEAQDADRVEAAEESVAESDDADRVEAAEESVAESDDAEGVVGTEESAAESGEQQLAPANGGRVEPESEPVESVPAQASEDDAEFSATEFPTERVSLEDLERFEPVLTDDSLPVVPTDTDRGETDPLVPSVAPIDPEDAPTVCGDPGEDEEATESMSLDALEAAIARGGVGVGTDSDDARASGEAQSVSPGHLEQTGDDGVAVEHDAEEDSLDVSDSTAQAVQRSAGDMGPPLMDRALSGAWQTVDAVVASLRRGRAEIARRTAPDPSVWLSLADPGTSLRNNAGQRAEPTFWLELGGPGARSTDEASPHASAPAVLDRPETPIASTPPEEPRELESTGASESIPMAPGPAVHEEPQEAPDTVEEELSVEHVLLFDDKAPSGAEVTLDGSEENSEDQPDVVAEGGAIRVALSLGSDEPPERATATRGVAVPPANAVQRRPVGASADSVEGVSTTDLVALARTTGGTYRVTAAVDEVATEEVASPTEIPAEGDDWLDGADRPEPTLGDDADAEDL